MSSVGGDPKEPVEGSGTSGDGYLEIQVDRETVVLVALAFVLLLGVSFLLGRWSARDDASEAPVEARVAREAEPEREPGALEEPAEEVDGQAPFGAVPVGSDAAEPVGQVPERAVTEEREGSPPGDSESAASSASRSESRGSPSPRATSEPEWVVQVAAVADAPDAERMRRRLAAAGFPVRVVKEGSWHKVQVGPYDTRREAQEVERRLKREEKVATWVKRS